MRGSGSLKEINALNAELAADLRADAQSSSHTEVEYEVLVGQLQEEERQAQQDLNDIDRQIEKHRNDFESLQMAVDKKDNLHQQATAVLNKIGPRTRLNGAKYDAAVKLFQETGDAWEAASKQLTQAEFEFDSKLAELLRAREEAQIALKEAQNNVATATQSPSMMSSMTKRFQGRSSEAQLNSIVIDDDDFYANTDNESTSNASPSRDTSASNDSPAPSPRSRDGSTVSNVSSLTDDSNVSKKSSVSSPRSRDGSITSRASTTSTSSQSVLSRHEKESLSDKQSLESFNLEWLSWFSKIQERGELVKLSEAEVSALTKLGEQQAEKSAALERLNQRIAVTTGLIDAEDEKVAGYSALWGMVMSAYNYVLTNIFRQELEYDKNKKLDRQLKSEAKGLKEDLATLDERIQEHTEMMHHIEQDIVTLDTEIEAIDYDRVKANIDKLTKRIEKESARAERVEAARASLIERCKLDDSRGILRAKESVGVVAIKNTLKDFLSTPTEETMASLKDAMRRYPEAYENNSEISALLKGASEIYPEIDDFRGEYKSRQEQNIQPEKAKSMTERISENNQQIKKLERELERVQQQEALIHSEEQNLVQLEQDLEALREHGPHASEPEYDEDGELINEECDEEELLEGIEDNKQRLEAARQELAGMGHQSEALEQEIERLYDENDALSSSRSHMINTQVDSLVQRCDEKVKGISQAEVQAKAALKTFILNPIPENLKAYQDVQKANPIVDEAANKRLDALVKDALTLVKDDPKGYKEVMAERASQTKASPSSPASQVSKYLDQLPSQGDVKKQEEAPKPQGFMSRMFGGS